MNPEQEIEKLQRRIAELEREAKQRDRDFAQLLAGLEEIETGNQAIFNRLKKGVIK